MRQCSWRFLVLVGFLILALTGICWRLFSLSVLNRPFLLKESQARTLRVIQVPADRGLIMDRTGYPLAVNMPAYSIWVDPRVWQQVSIPEWQLQQLAQRLGQSANSIRQRVQRASRREREFVYLKRGVAPPAAEQIMRFNIPGVFQRREYRRYYPDADIPVHVVGLSNVDGQGQEGMELVYNSWLRGEPGKQEVLQDRNGQIVAELGMLQQPQQGHNLSLSVENQIQYLAYHSLRAAIQQHHARSGSVVVLNVKTGEVLAMVNQPAYDPNSHFKQGMASHRNRAVTDTFEPGSTIKPFTIALALESGRYTPNSIVDTRPGWMRVGGYKIADELNYGVLRLGEILKKSSNIGAAKVMLSLQAQAYWNLLSQLGFGQRTGSGFPGESAGRLPTYRNWYPSVLATLAYGYGIAVTALQLAKAYAVLANEGVSLPTSFIKVESAPTGKQVIRKQIAHTILQMLESVVETGGTGTRARVLGYRVAGKTGTAYVATPKGYDKHQYISSFVGVAPVSHPQLVVAVVIHSPQGEHFGAVVAAPVFAEVMGGALRHLGVTPDNLHSME